MARVTKCDSCSDVIDEEAFDFNINPLARGMNGELVLLDGRTTVKWEHIKEYGDLCSECSESIIEEINEVLK